MRDNLADEEMIPTWVDGRLQPMGKMAVHRAGLKHKAVSVFVTDGARVLIQRRALSKYHTPGLWANTCCTHPRWSEDAAACAVRRLREELGITGLFPAFADRVEYRADVGGGLTEHEVVDIFVADVTPAMTLAPNPDEVAEVAWMDLYDLSADTARNPAKYTPWLQIYMAEHMSRIFGAAVR
jgi:isopentenyl-diphosphate Delta-isomerase